jgi:ribosome-binding factor A
MGRIPRLNRLIKEELSKIILKEIDIQEGTILTLIRVDTSPDLASSKVYFSVIPEENMEKVFRSLNSEIYEIQHLLNRKLKMRRVPKIIFLPDKNAGNAERVEELLEKIKKKKIK